ncbi:MAG: N-acetylneuraminate synthase family protein [Rhodothermales bacterium]
MARTVDLGDRCVGHDEPVYVIAEIGINHNGDLEIAKKLIDAAKVAGVDAVKFQKRTPEKAVPPEQAEIPRVTPWGTVSYLEYKERVELGEEEYAEVNRYCKEREITWFASVWDEDSVAFMERFDPVCYKIPSAALTDHDLLRLVREQGRPVILSTGMSTMEQIREAAGQLDMKNLIITHCTSTYPAKIDELNLRMIHTLRDEFDCPIGYSGHEVGLQVSYAAVALGACVVERHITLDRAMWGSDQAASVEPWGFMRLMRDVRVIERAMGDGVKKVYESELPILKKLRRVKAVQ